MGRPKHHPTELTPGDREQLLEMVRHGHESARVIRRANSLLLADEGHPDNFIANILRAGRDTIRRTRNKYAHHGLQAALREGDRPGATPRLDHRQQALLVAIACNEAPHGRDAWTMQLLADKLVELGVVDEIRDDTVWRALKKRPQAVAAEALVHHQGKRRLHLAPGGRARPVRRGVRPPAAGGVRRRAALPARC